MRLLMGKIDLRLGDCLKVLKEYPDNCIDAVVTDPPYGISFMGKGWDYDVPSVQIWKEVFRVLKPGGHLIAFSSTRTYHMMAIKIENAGFEIRDMISWLYGSGFPKSHDVSKGIDNWVGAERAIIGKHEAPAKSIYSQGLDEMSPDVNLTSPASPAAKQWKGWGTALKPACEPAVLCQKPFDGTVAENSLRWGVGGLNIDGSRIAHNEQCKMMAAQGNEEIMTGDGKYGQAGRRKPVLELKPQGRWPANVLFDEAAAEMLDEQSGPTNGGGKTIVKTDTTQMFGMKGHVNIDYPDSGGPSRFFYCAKSSKSERNAGLEGMPERVVHHDGRSSVSEMPAQRHSIENQNFHPTVKPIKLMEYLVRLVTPPGGVVLDPFMGSGSTGCAATKLGFNFLGVEMNEEYLEIAKRRIEHFKSVPASGVSDCPDTTSET